MNLNHWVGVCHDLAVSKGWWEKPRSPLEVHMLIVSEIAEATEDVRRGLPAIYVGEPDHFSAALLANLEKINQASGRPSEDKNEGFYTWLRETGQKPNGEAVELADAVIRIFDYFGHKGWDLEKILKLKLDYNAGRPHRHGGKTA